MSEHLMMKSELARAKLALLGAPVTEHGQSPERTALWCLIRALDSAPPASPETLTEGKSQSGSTSQESDGASPENLATEPTRATGITGPINSLSLPGGRLEVKESPQTQSLASRITEPTSSTPSTDHSTGLSARSDDEAFNVIAEQRYWDGYGRGVREAQSNADEIINDLKRQLHERDKPTTRTPTGFSPAPEPSVEEEPIPMLLDCPECHLTHVDEGEWATRPHRIHRCAGCGFDWFPATVNTVGVAKLSLPPRSIPPSKESEG